MHMPFIALSMDRLQKHFYVLCQVLGGNSPCCGAYVPPEAVFPLSINTKFLKLEFSLNYVSIYISILRNVYNCD